ncbi:MAG: ATP-binding protein [Bacteroidota bacterium]|nr:ATP-binding protein [Bacteroidota bacterium]
MKKGLAYITVSVVLLLIAVYFSNFILRQNLHEVVVELQEDILQREQAIRKLSKNLIHAYHSNDNKEAPLINRISEEVSKQNAEVLIYKNDSLYYWTGNKVPIGFKEIRGPDIMPFVELSNGYYQVLQVQDHDFFAYAFILIKSDYPYQNEFLINDFSNYYPCASSFDIELSKNDYNLLDASGYYLFSLSRNSQSKLIVSSANEVWLFLLYFAGFLFLIAFIYRLYRQFFSIFRNEFLLNLTFAIDIIIIRAVLYYFQIPGILYKTTLFSSHFYASSVLMPSLGDFFVNIILVLVIVLLIVRSQGFSLPESWSKRSRVITVLLMLIGSVIVYDAVIFQIESLVLDSSVPLQLDNIFDLDFAGILSLFSIASLLMIFFLFSARFLQMYEEVFHSNFLAGLLLVILASLINYPLIESQPIINQIFITIYLLSLYMYFAKFRDGFTAGFIIYNLLIFALITTFIINHYDRKREIKNQEMLVEKILMRENPLLEFLFKDVKERIGSDEKIVDFVREDYLQSANDDSLSVLIMQHFDDPFWQQYDILITACDSTKELMVEPDDYIINCQQYFSNFIQDVGMPTGVNDLYVLNDNTIDKNYLARVRMDYPEIQLAVYIEFYSRFIPEGLGYPELLINKASELDPFLKEHSVAKYREGELVYKFGNYHYSIYLGNYAVNDSIPGKLQRNNYDHSFYKLDDDAYLVVSRQALNFFDFIAPLAYLLLSFSIYILVFLLITRKPREVFKNTVTFRKRLQISIISIVFVTFLFIGILSISYIISINNAKTEDVLTEKSHSVLIEMEHKLADIEALDPELYPYINEILIKFSQVFFTDINLYDLSGKLVASSRPQIFDEGLISTRMDNVAMGKILEGNKLLFIHSERIGNYEYLSAYMPFRNAQKDLIAVLNLPYFAKQDALKDEISTFLTAFINVYLIIFVIAIIVTIIISQQITKPLLLIRSKMSQLQLVKTNDKINWSSKDELGQLVDEYNRMIGELDKSAEMLARSERETAWREMAKQVAHEIKNPLTPMKLSIQHLKRMIEQKDESWESQFKKISNTIIEQIDSLSSIASEFSDFAKMPLGKMENIDLCDILNRGLELYKNTGIEISMKSDVEAPCIIHADEKQLMRAFNNLIENSIQAVEGLKVPRIDIRLEETLHHYRLSIRDNGKGIEPEIVEKIFSPNFTTKSGGMGLGLAIVKSIIGESGGEIDFSSEPGRGTTFVVVLPKLNRENGIDP